MDISQLMGRRAQNLTVVYGVPVSPALLQANPVAMVRSFI